MNGIAEQEPTGGEPPARLLDGIQLEHVGRFWALVIALTPAVGFAIRWFAFEIAGHVGPSLRIAAAEPFVVYAATGGVAMSLVILGTVGILFGQRQEYEAREGDAGARSMWQRLLLHAWPGWLVLLIGLIFLPGGWLIFPLVLMVALLARWLIRKYVPPEVRLSTWWAYWPIAVIGGFAATVVMVVLGVVPGIGSGLFEFRGRSGIPDGRYIQLARNEDVTFLQPCGDVSGGTIQVPTTSIRVATLESDSMEFATPSLFEMVFQGDPVQAGLSLRCPDPPAP